MSVSKVVNGTSYTLPEPGDNNWGQDVTDWMIAMSDSTIQLSAGSFSITADLDMSNVSNYGLITEFLKANDYIGFDGTTNTLTVSGDSLQWGGNDVLTTTAASPGDLDMGGNNITGVGSITVTTDVTVGGSSVLVDTDIGSTVQAYDANLDQIAALTPTKGNLMSGTGSAWSSRAIGSDGAVLVADSSEADGIKWAITAGVNLESYLFSSSVVTAPADLGGYAGHGSLVIGDGAEITGTSASSWDNIVIGNSATVSYISSSAHGRGNIAIGYRADIGGSLAPGHNGIAIGTDAEVRGNTYGGDHGIAIGSHALASGTTTATTDKANPNIAIGWGAQASGSASAGNSSSIAIGEGALANGSRCIAIGGPALGGTAAADGQLTTGFNTGASSSGIGGTAIGYSASATGSNFSIAIGQATSIYKYATAIGAGAATMHPSSMSIGFGDGTRNKNFVLLEADTTDATPTEMLDTDGAQFILPNNYVGTYEVIVTARDTSYNVGCWKFTFVAKNNAGTFTIAGPDDILTEIITKDVSSWDVAVTTDATNKVPAITVTGASATTITWSAQVNLTIIR